MATLNTHGLELVRSDTGDGGWSLHLPEGLADEVLLSDLSTYTPDTDEAYGDWDRPTQADYDTAWARAKEMIEQL
jgi:hypothetical protein